jgi:hypothetical protein
MADHIEGRTKSQTIRGFGVTHLRNLASILEEFEKTIENRMPSDTPERHVQRIKTNAEGVIKKANTVSDTLFRHVADALDRVEKQARERAGIKPTTGTESAEIRAAVRSMNRKAQLELLRGRDPVVLSALLGGHMVTHGIDPDTLSATVNDAIAKAAPEEIAEIRELEEFAETISVSTKQAKQAATDATASDYVSDVLKRAGQAESVHNSFIEQLNQL